MAAAGGWRRGTGGRIAAGTVRDTAGLDWPQFLHDPQHSSVSQATAFTPANSGSVTQVWQEWSRRLDTCPRRGITATAAVKPDPVTGVSTAYVSGAHFLYALDAVTG